MRSYRDIFGRRAVYERMTQAVHQQTGYYRPTYWMWAIFAAVASLWCAVPATAAEPIAVDVDRPPGKLVDIGTHRLYLYCMGRGSPTVVLDAGLGGSSLEWLVVQQQVAVHTRVCAYDRAGYGWSDAGPGPRTSLRNAMELHALLANAGIEPPYVLTGHSFGGYDVQLFASLYPDTVSGMVLVDSSHGRQVERFEAEPIGVSTAPRPGSAILMSRPAVPKNLPANLSETVATLMSTSKTLLATTDELVNFRLSAQQVTDAAAWPDVPVVVLTRGQRVWPSDEKGRLMEALWMELQDELAQRNPRSLHIVVRGSGHHIHLEQPTVVARAVSLLLQEPRKPMLSHAVLSAQPNAFTTRFVAHATGDERLLSQLYIEKAAGGFSASN